MIKVSDIAVLLSVSFEGESNVFVETVDDIRGEKQNFLSFVADASFLKYAANSKASVLFVEENIFNADELKHFLLQTDKKRACFCIKGAYKAFLKVLYTLHPNAGITGFQTGEQKQLISDEAKIDSTAIIYPNVFLGTNSVVGKNCIIFSGTVIMENVTIGDNVVIYPNVTVYPNTKLGDRVIVGSSTVLGSDGFGFVEDEGKFIKVPHLGSTIIGDDVEIGSNSSVDRGTLGNTIIGDGTKIDNLVQVAHNCIIGKNCILCGMVGLSGSTILGNNVIMGANSGTKGHIKIEDNCVVTARSSISKDLAKGSQVKGYPAKPIPEALKIQTLVAKLPDLYERIKKIEREIFKNEKRNS